MALDSVDPYSAPPPAIIAKAIVAIQKQLEPLVKSASNDEYDSGYVPLEDAAPKAHKLLTEHGIAVLQPLTSDADGRPEIETTLVHEDGEYFMRKTRLVLGEKQNPQGHMSAITYMRRGALMSTIGMTGRGEDDDGNKASGVFAPVTEEQKDRLRSLMKHLKYPKTAMANEIFNIKTRDHAYLAIKNFEQTVAMKARDEESKANAEEVEFGKKITVTEKGPEDQDEPPAEVEPTSLKGFRQRIKALGLKDEATERKVVAMGSGDGKNGTPFLVNVMEKPERIERLNLFLLELETNMHNLPGDFYATTDEPRVVEENVA